MDSAVFENAFSLVDGLPRPDWPFIRRWIETNVAERDRYAAWDAAAETWLKKLRDHLGKAYFIDALDEFGMLSAMESRDADALLRHAVTAKQSMQAILKLLPAPVHYGPHILLVFRNAEEFCTYISYFYPEGDHSLPAGVCLRADYVHMVFLPARLDTLRYAVTHELTHALLAHLSLPQWLEEGVAQLMEECVNAANFGIIERWTFRIDHETARRHKSYWPNHGLQGYWSGRVFGATDEGRELAYSLSQVLARNLLADHKKQFFDFVAEARSCDAGESAMQKHLGMSLADCVAQFLGPGNWSPDFAALAQDEPASESET